MVNWGKELAYERDGLPANYGTIDFGIIPHTTIEAYRQYIDELFKENNTTLVSETSTTINGLLAKKLVSTSKVMRDVYEIAYVVEKDSQYMIYT